MAPRTGLSSSSNGAGPITYALNKLYPAGTTAPTPAPLSQNPYPNYSSLAPGNTPNTPVSTYNALPEPFKSPNPEAQPAQPAQTVSDYRTCCSRSTALKSTVTRSTGFQSQNGATWKGSLGKTNNNGFASGNPGYKGVREGREKGVGLPKRKGVGRTGKEPAKVPKKMLKELGVDAYEGDIVRLRHEGREHRLKFFKRSLDEDVWVEDLRNAAAIALNTGEKMVKLWYKDVEMTRDDALCADYGLTDNSRVICATGSLPQTKATRRREAPHVKFSIGKDIRRPQSPSAEDLYASDNDSDIFQDCFDDSYKYSRPAANLFPPPPSFNAVEARRQLPEDLQDIIASELNFLGVGDPHHRLPTRSHTTESTIKGAETWPPRDEVLLKRSALERRRTKLLELRRLAFNSEPGISNEETVRFLRQKVADISATGSNFASDQNKRDVDNLRQMLNELSDMYDRKRLCVPGSDFRAEKRRRDRVVEDIQRMIEDMVD